MSDHRNAAAASGGLPDAGRHRAGDPPPLADAGSHKLFLLRDVGPAALRYPSFVDRAGDAVARWAGDVRFFIVHAFAYAAWMVVNSGLVPGVPAFDPYPFGFLGLVMALEVSCLSTAVLMRQNRQSELADRRALLDLQVNLVAEQEATRVLQLLQAICGHLGVERAPRGLAPNQVYRTPSRMSKPRDPTRAEVV